MRVLRALGFLLLVLLAALPLPAQQPQKPSEDPRQRCLGKDPKAPILIEVFSDYQCPGCRRFYLETMRSVLADYAVNGRACVVYYEFPLDRQHPYARQAARFGHAAARLGGEKWIQVTDALFYYQAQWSTDGKLESVIAKSLTEKEMSQLKEYANDPKLEELINRDVALGRSRGVTGTPTTFVTANGRTERLPAGVFQYQVFRRYLDALLTGSQ